MLEPGKESGRAVKGTGMKFGTREDIEAPIEFVFAQITDFPAIERAAMRRGAEVERCNGVTSLAPGMAWDTRFELRGKQREMHLELSEVDPPNGLTLLAGSPNLDGKMEVVLVALSPGRTRMMTDFEIKPKNLIGKLLIQSLKLARKRLTGGIKDRMTTYAGSIEKRFRQST